MVLVGLKLTTRQWRELSLYLNALDYSCLQFQSYWYRYRSIASQPTCVHRLSLDFRLSIDSFYSFTSQPIYTFVNGFVVHLVPFDPFRMHLYFCENSIYSWQYLVLLELNLVSPRLFLRYNLWVCSQMGPRFIFCFIFLFIWFYAIDVLGRITLLSIRFSWKKIKLRKPIDLVTKKKQTQNLTNVFLIKVNEARITRKSTLFFESDEISWIQ